MHKLCVASYVAYCVSSKLQVVEKEDLMSISVCAPRIDVGQFSQS